ncbi:hypothetical protein Tco_1271532 [Tanacetum coccineum]
MEHEASFTLLSSGHGWPSVVEWHAVVRGLHSLRNRRARTHCDRVQVMLFAELLSLCSLRLCTDYASCGAAGVWSLWAFPSVGLGPVAYSMVRARGPDDAIRHHAPVYSIYTVTSVLTQRELDHHRSVFNIRADLRLELPDRNATIKDRPAGKIGMYTRFIEFANFRIPLSKFLLCVLKYYQINLSQLSVICAAKVSHFEIICRVFGRVPTVGTSRRLYVNSISNGWLSFSKRGGVDDPCCYSKKFDSLKNWNNRFFWIDASVCPLSVSWFSGVSCGSALCGIVEMKAQMGLLDFVKSVNHFKVKVGERTLAENEVPLQTETEDRVISPSAETISLVDHTLHDEL